MSQTSLIFKEWRADSDTLPPEFFSIPAYASWPNAWPEDEASVRFQFSSANDYFRGGKAVIALIPGKVRVAAFARPDQTLSDRKVVYFGFYETVNDPSANAEVFQAISKWAKDEGAEALVGPMNFSTMGAYRIRVGGKVEDDVIMGEPFNPPYYEDLLKGLGFQCQLRFETVRLPIDKPYLDYIHMRTENRQHKAYTQFQFRSLDAETWQKRLPEFHELTMTFFQGAPGFKPISFEAFKAVYGPVISVRQCPYSTLYMTTPEDRIMAYALCFPNYGSVVRRDAKEPPLLGKDLTFEKAFPRMNTPELVVKTIGVHSDFRGGGLQHVLVGEAILRAYEKGYRSVALALMREGNPSNKLYPSVPVTHRHYELFGKALGGS